MCGSNLASDAPMCPNCGANSTHKNIGGVTPRSPADKGKQVNPYRDEGIFIQKNTPFTRAANTKQAGIDEEEKPKKKKKEERKAWRLQI